VSRYELLVFLHIGCAIVWLGAGLLMSVLELKASRSGDPAAIGRIGADNEWLAPRLFIPAALLTLIFGILLVADGPWTIGTLWIDLGLAGFALTFAVGIGVLEPTSKKLKVTIERDGPTSPEAARLGHRLVVASRLDLVVLFIVVAVMASKPASGDAGTLAGLGIGVVAASVVVAFLSRRKVVAAPEAPSLPVQ
jgi:uncharacterized membrane protein